MSAVEARHVAIGRVVFGVAALVKLFELAPRMLQMAEPGAYRYPWWQGWSPGTNFPWAWILGWALLAALFTLGWRVPWTGVGLATVMGLVMSTDQQLYSNHLYLMVLLALLLTWADSGATWSADARRVGPRDVVSGLPVLLLKLQLTAVYLFAALAKINPSFLSGEVLASHQGGALVQLPGSLIVPSILGPVAVAAVVTEAFLALAPWTRIRGAVPFVAVVFHVGIVLFVTGWLPLLVFTLAMGTMLVLFWAEPRARPAVREQKAFG